MALGPGISYRDWVNKINDTQLLGSKEINLTLINGTELIDIKNLTTPRLRQITRVTPVLMDPTLYPPTGTSYTATFKLEMTYTGRINMYDGQQGMTIGCVSFLNHNLSLTNGGDPNDIYIEVILKNEIGATMASESVKILDGKYEDKTIHFLLSQVYTGVYIAEISIIADVQILNTNFEIGRLWVGNYLEACFDSGYGFEYGSASKELLSSQNDSYLGDKTPRNKMSFDFTLIDESTVFGINSWKNLSKTISTNKDIIILPRTETQDLLEDLGIYGKLTKPARMDHDKGQYWNTSLDVVQLL